MEIKIRCESFNQKHIRSKIYCGKKISGKTRGFVVLSMSHSTLVQLVLKRIKLYNLTIQITTKLRRRNFRSSSLKIDLKNLIRYFVIYITSLNLAIHFSYIMKSQNGD